MHYRANGSLLAVACCLLLVAASGCGAGADGSDLPYCLPADVSVAQLWCESPMRKVSPAEQPPAARGDEIMLFAARGEAEPAQIVVRPLRALRGVHVRLGDLTGPGRLAEKNLSANFVGWISVEKPLWQGNQTGPVPDPLLPNAPMDLEPGKSRPIWVTISVPREAPAGDYAGNLWLEGEGVRLPVALRLHVFDFALPGQPTLAVLARLWNVPPDQKPIWWRNLARHRISGEAYPGPLQVRFSGATPALDLESFDAAEADYFGEPGLSLQHLPQIGLGDGATLRANGRWAGQQVFSPEFDAMFRAYCAAMADHLRAKGWLRGTHFQFWDEPDAEGVDTCARLARLVRAAAPDAKVYLTAAPIRELYGLVDIWCVPLIHGFPADACAERREAGDQIWAYDNRLFSLDVDSSSLDLREFPWRLFTSDTVGIEWWAVNKWTSDPYQVPNQYPRQNGGGFFLYPPRGGNEPVNSIRWEMVREGIEDHDYLALLQQAIDAARSRLGIVGPTLAGRDRAKALCSLVAAGVDRAAPDWRVLAATRLQVAREIVFYQQGPDVVFAVQPDGQGIVGRAQPGTRIRLDGDEVPVADDGSFTWRAQRVGRAVEIVASRGAASKSLRVAL